MVRREAVSVLVADAKAKGVVWSKSGRPEGWFERAKDKKMERIPMK